MIELELSRGYKTTIDDEDYELAEMKWSLVPDQNFKLYAKRIFKYPNRKTVSLHRIVLERKLGHDIPEGFEVDHINGNTLDNRRCNLRMVTRSQNIANEKKPLTNTSGYKGVSYVHRFKKWRVKIQGDYVGMYKFPEEAAKVYDYLAVNRFGEFANLNFPELIDYYKTCEPPELYPREVPKSSKYKGVTWNKGKNRWTAQIMVNRKHIHIGHFKTEEEAYQARLQYEKDHLSQYL